jgi:hypothetical protein
MRATDEPPGGFRKAICSSDVAVEQLSTLQEEGLENFVKILKHFARGEMKCVN